MAVDATPVVLHARSGGVGDLTATLALVVAAGHAAVAHLIYFDARARDADRPERWAVRYVFVPVVLPYYLRVRERAGERTEPLSGREKVSVVVALAGLVAGGLAVYHHPENLTNETALAVAGLLGPVVLVYLLVVAVARLRESRDEASES